MRRDIPLVSIHFHVAMFNQETFFFVNSNGET